MASVTVIIYHLRDGIVIGKVFLILLFCADLFEGFSHKSLFLLTLTLDTGINVTDDSTTSISLVLKLLDRVIFLTVRNQF